MIIKFKERFKRNEEGFTLTELLVVILVLGVIAAIAIPVFSNQQKASIVASVKSDVKASLTELSTALVKRPQGVFVGLKSATLYSSKIGLNTPNQKDWPLEMVYSAPATTIQVLGTWDRYYVIGVNTDIGPFPAFATSVTSTGTSATLTMTVTGNQFGVLFDSATGKTITRGA